MPVPPGPSLLKTSGWRTGPRPLFAIGLVAIGAALFLFYGIWAVEAAEGFSSAAQQGEGSLGGSVSLHFTCVGPCPWTQALVTLSVGVVLVMAAVWLLWRPQYHVVEGLAVCVAVATGETLLIGPVDLGPWLPTLIAAVGGVWAIVWSPTPRTIRVRVAKHLSSP